MKSKKINEISVKFSALSKNEALARIIVVGFLMPYSPSVEEIADIKTAVSEAVTNAVVHAYKGRETGEVYLKAHITESGDFCVSVVDRGCGIENVQKAMEPLFTTDAENERSGMGFSIMQTFSDKFRVVSKVGRGTRVTMYRRLESFKSE